MKIQFLKSIGKGNGKCLRKFPALENLEQDYVDGCKGRKKVLSIDA